MDSFQYSHNLISFESTSTLSNVAISDYIENVLTKIGFKIERLEYDDPNGIRKACIIGKKGEGSGGLAYFGHTDVVPVNAWFSKTKGPYTPNVIDDKLYGRGSCDMKGSIACILEAAEQFPAETLKNPIYITCTSDEEISLDGAKQVAQNSKFYREMVEGKSNGIIGEPTMLEVVYSHKGTAGFQAISHGKAAHSSTNEGVNANLAMIPFLLEMKILHDETESDPKWKNEEFDPPTMRWNIIMKDNCKALNITPPESICIVRFRPMPGQNVEPLIKRARKAAKKCGLEFETGLSGTPLYSDPQSDFIKDVLQKAGKTTPKTVSYGSDGMAFTAMEKLVVFGPGNIAMAHTDNEWIDLDQLKLGSKKYFELIQHWCN